MNLADQDLHTFLDLVFAWTGAEETTWKSVFYTFIGQDKKQHFAGVAAQSKAELIKQITFYRARNKDVYVTLGSQLTSTPKDGKPTAWPKANRFASNILAHKTLFIDVDVGKEGAYDTLDEAYLAVDQFCADANIPLPNLRVASGGGLHAYWVMDTPVLVKDWQPMADALKSAVHQHGLKADTQCTVDPCRILRVPSTYNFKIEGNPRPVMMYDPGTVYTYPQMTNALSPYIGSAAANVSAMSAASHPHANPRQTTYNQNFSANQETRHATVDIMACRDAGCGVLDEAIETGGATHRQPLWNLMILAASFDSIDPIDMAHMVSDGHPDYTVDGTRDMLARKVSERLNKPGGLGFPSCKAISNTQAGPICHACPHFSRGQSPLNLAHLKTAQPSPAATAALDLPDGYWADVNHRIFTKVKGEKKEEPIDKCVMNYPVLGGALTEYPDDLTFDTMIGNKHKRILVEKKDLASTRSIMPVMLNQGVIVHTDQEKIARSFMLSWTEKLQTLAQRGRVKATGVGWSGDSFSYGDVLYTPTGKGQAFYNDTVLAEKYKPRGQLRAWTHAAKPLLGETALETIVASSFAAPLVKLAGHNGLIISAFSPDSGVGKTTALKVAQTVWAAPDFMMQVNDTNNAVAKRMAEVRSLPVYYDEMGMNKELEEVAKFIFALTGGREKNRLNSSSQAQDAKSFQTLMLSCANSSLAEIMARSNKSTAAGTNRVLEFVVPKLKHPLPGGDMQFRIADLEDNYGRAGELYIEHIVANIPTVKALIKHELESITRDLQAESEDRFWVASCAVVVTAARIVRHLGILSLNVDEIRTLMLNAYVSQRQQRANANIDLRDTFNLTSILHTFISEFMNRQLLLTNKIYRSRGRPGPTEVMDLTPQAKQGSLQNIQAQLARDENILRVSTKFFDEWLAKQGYSSRIVLREIEKLPGFSKDRCAIASGTPYKYDAPGLIWCYDIPVPDAYATSDPGSS